MDAACIDIILRSFLSLILSILKMNDVWGEWAKSLSLRLKQKMLLYFIYFTVVTFLFHAHGQTFV